MTGLAPGEYRVIAIASTTQDLLMNVTNAMFERLMATATKVELSPGGFQNITLEPSVLSPQPIRP